MQGGNQDYVIFQRDCMLESIDKFAVCMPHSNIQCNRPSGVGRLHSNWYLRLSNVILNNNK